MLPMSSWRTLLVAALISSVVAACGSKATSKKSSDDDDDDEPRSSKSESSDSSDSASASASGSGATPKTKAPAKAAKDAVVLDNGTHRVAVVVKSDGATEVVAFDTKDAPIAADEVKGKVRADQGDWVDLDKDGDGLKAKLGKLDDGLTNVQLNLKIEGKAFEESIDVPEGGTKALQEESKIVIAEGTKGPNGGVVDVVGDQRVELVVDEETGDVRVYYLDENLKVMDIPEGTEVTLNFDDEDKK